MTTAPMTPTALHELVRDVPEVIPTSLEFVDGMLWLYRDHKGIVAEISTEHAADLILAGVVRKLVDHDLGIFKTPTYGHPTVQFEYGEDVYMVTGWSLTDHTAFGPSMLHAALAAYRRLVQ
jgi:hypothetical protein